MKVCDLRMKDERITVLSRKLTGELQTSQRVGKPIRIGILGGPAPLVVQHSQAKIAHEVIMLRSQSEIHSSDNAEFRLALRTQ